MGVSLNFARPNFAQFFFHFVNDFLCKLWKKWQKECFSPISSLPKSRPSLLIAHGLLHYEQNESQLWQIYAPIIIFYFHLCYFNQGRPSVSVQTISNLSRYLTDRQTDTRASREKVRQLVLILSYYKYQPNLHSLKIFCKKKSSLICDLEGSFFFAKIAHPDGPSDGLLSTPPPPKGEGRKEG